MREGLDESPEDDLGPFALGVHFVVATPLAERLNEPPGDVGAGPASDLLHERDERPARGPLAEGVIDSSSLTRSVLCRRVLNGEREWRAGGKVRDPSVEPVGRDGQGEVDDEI